jgi:hypothetical protein
VLNVLAVVHCYAVVPGRQQHVHTLLLCSTNYIVEQRTIVVGGYSSAGSRGLVCQFSAPSVGDRCHRITSVVFSSDGTDLLVSYSSDYIYLFNFKVCC